MPANPEPSKVRETFKLELFSLGKRMFLGDLIVAFQYFIEASKKYGKNGTNVFCCNRTRGNGFKRGSN